MTNHTAPGMAPFKTGILGTAVALVLGTGTFATPTSAQAELLSASWTGLHTLLDSNGNPLDNVSLPYYYDPTWGYGYRTQVSGTLTFDTATGTGSMAIAPFQWGAGNPAYPMTFHDVTLHRVGDGNGGPGPLLDVSMLWDWNGNYNTAAELILDASGFFDAIGGGATMGQGIDQASTAGSGALPASNDTGNGEFPIGPVPLATTTYDSTFPLSGDGIGGIPMSGGPFPQMNHNFDITSLTVVDVTQMPVPPTVWLFGPGLLGLLGCARRRRTGSGQSGSTTADRAQHA